MIFAKDTCQNQFRMPNYPSISSFEEINALLPKLYHLQYFHALQLSKLLQQQQQQQQQKKIWQHELASYIKWGIVNKFQEKNLSCLVVMNKKL